MVRSRAADAHEQKVLDDIANYGWHCVNILAEGDEGPYSFTVGLFQTERHPELLIYGLQADVAHAILGNAVAELRQKRLDLRALNHALLQGYACCFIEVPKQAYYEHVGFARWYYQGDDFPLYQIVWPSRDAKFPWQRGTSAEFRRIQPVLGHAS